MRCLRPRSGPISGCVPAPTRILVLNRGSSSLKFALFDAAGTIRRVDGGTVERVKGNEAVFERVVALLAGHGGLTRVDAVGHRIVHGGATFTEPTLVDAGALVSLKGLAELDPTHLPPEIALVEEVLRSAPELPQVACFDTAFHASMPRAARLFALPSRYEKQGLRRYGFHGLSYRYLLGELARVAGEEAARGRVVLAHLGSGASLAAVRGGHPLDTTMSFTPNSGVPMSTRSGDLNPGVLAYLGRREGLSLPRKSTSS